MENIFWNPFCKIPIHLPAMSTAAKMLFSKWTTGAVKVSNLNQQNYQPFVRWLVDWFVLLRCADWWVDSFADSGRWPQLHWSITWMTTFLPQVLWLPNGYKILRKKCLDIFHDKKKGPWNLTFQEWEYYLVNFIQKHVSSMKLIIILFKMLDKFS